MDIYKTHSDEAEEKFRKLNVAHHAERVARRMAEDPEYAEAYRLATEDIKRHDALHRHNSHIVP